jgi:hypothetical protein
MIQFLKDTRQIAPISNLLLFIIRMEERRVGVTNDGKAKYGIGHYNDWVALEGL